MILVTCAIILNSKRQILVTQRSATMNLPLKWEFPGGKLEVGETAEECLIREIKEELNIRIEITASLPSNDHQYPDKLIRLIPFTCKYLGDEIQLKEHTAFRWMEVQDLMDLDWADADIPIAKQYLELRKKCL